MSLSHILCGQCRVEDPWFWKGPALAACTVLVLSGLSLQQGKECCSIQAVILSSLEKAPC